MNNFEKFKADLTLERLVDMLVDGCGAACDYCAYAYSDCEVGVDCVSGIKKSLESEVEI